SRGKPTEAATNQVADPKCQCQIDYREHPENNVGNRLSAAPLNASRPLPSRLFFRSSYFDLTANLNLEMRGVPMNPVSAPVSSTYNLLSFSDPNNASAVGLLKSSGPPDFRELRNLPSVANTSTSFDRPLVTYKRFASASYVASGRFHAYLPQALTSHCRTNFPCRSNTCMRLLPVSATNTNPPPIAIPVDSRN